jgi:uncharacterized membrane protein YeiH
MSASVGALSDAFRAIDLTGVFANALLGGVAAREERMDPVGFATLAILSGLGGGMIRDTLLQHGTPIALTDYAYVLTALGGATVAFLLLVGGRLWDRAWPVIDALALGCWASTGAQKTLGAGLGWLPAILLGTITAVGGGAVRDIVLRRRPAIFGGNTLYATSAIAASAVMVGFYRAGQASLGLIVATAFGSGLTLLARWRDWHLPEAPAWRPARLGPVGRGRRAGGAPEDGRPPADP